MGSGSPHHDIGTERLPEAVLPGNFLSVTNPGFLEPCGREGAAWQDGVGSFRRFVSGSGSHLGLPRAGNSTGVLVQKEPAGGARAPAALQVESELPDHRIIPITKCFSPPPTLLLKSRFQRCREVFWNSSLFLLPLYFCLRRLAQAG